MNALLDTPSPINMLRGLSSIDRLRYTSSSFERVTGPLPSYRRVTGYLSFYERITGLLTFYIYIYIYILRDISSSINGSPGFFSSINGLRGLLSFMIGSRGFPPSTNGLRASLELTGRGYLSYHLSGLRITEYPFRIDGLRVVSSSLQTGYGASSSLIDNQSRLSSSISGLRGPSSLANGLRVSLSD